MPVAMATEIFKRAGHGLDEAPPERFVGVDDMVDAAPAGSDRGDFITIPSLPNVAD